MARLLSRGERSRSGRRLSAALARELATQSLCEIAALGRDAPQKVVERHEPDELALLIHDREPPHAVLAHHARHLREGRRGGHRDRRALPDLADLHEPRVALLHQDVQHEVPVGDHTHRPLTLGRPPGSRSRPSPCDAPRRARSRKSPSPPYSLKTMLPSLGKHETCRLPATAYAAAH